jgi:peptidoglycan LD-endopeptidase LytH
MRVHVCAMLTVAVMVTACDLRGKPEATTCNLRTTRIADSSIGPLYVDEALPALRVRCPGVGDTMLAQPGVAGSVHALRLIVADAPVIIRTNGAKVTALFVESPTFRTADSIGVGTSVTQFRDARGIRVTRVAGTPYATLIDRRRCGISFELSGWGQDTLPPPDAPPLGGESLATWPAVIVIRAVTVSGCHGVTGDVGVDSIAEAPLAADSSAPAPDTSRAAAPAIPPATASPLPTLGAPPSDTGAIIATEQELDELRANLVVPVQGVARSQLRDTYTESRNAGRLHEAIDILAPRGTPVLSATDGKLLKLFMSKAGGLMVYASDRSSRFILLYAHMDRYATGLREGMPLQRGQVIGFVGTTGNAPANTPHLHFGILRGRPSVAWWKGTAVNPYPLLAPATR